jgi:hypothetical protein
MKEAVKLALDALKMADELCRGHGVDFKEYGLEFDRDIQVKYKAAITAIKKALAQPAPDIQRHNDYMAGFNEGYDRAEKNALYTTPPKRPWVGLTDEDISSIWHNCKPYYDEDDFARAIEAKLKEKNT